MNYKKTILTLIELLRTANCADSKSAKSSWQESTDASSQSYFGHLSDAIVSIAGQEFFDYWCETGDLDWSSATREDFTDYMCDV